MKHPAPGSMPARRLPAAPPGPCNRISYFRALANRPGRVIWRVPSFPQTYGGRRKAELRHAIPRGKPCGDRPADRGHPFGAALRSCPAMSCPRLQAPGPVRPSGLIREGLHRRGRPSFTAVRPAGGVFGSNHLARRAPNRERVPGDRACESVAQDGSRRKPGAPWAAGATGGSLSANRREPSG